MNQITQNVFVESGLLACTLGLIRTSEGTVAIDTPIGPTRVFKWLDEIKDLGPNRYIINSEEHGDHCNYSYFFPGVMVTSRETRRKMSATSTENVVNSTKRMDPEGVPLMKGFRFRLADVAFTGDLSLYLGNHTFQLFPLPGHCTGGIGIYIPGEKAVFTSDCVFHGYKSFTHEAQPEVWLESLARLQQLDIEFVVPGHGTVGKKDCIQVQADIIKQWIEVVKSAIKQGWTEEEAVARIASPDPYPKQPNTPMDEEGLRKATVSHLYKLYSS